MTQVFFSLAAVAFIGALLRQFLPAAEEARQHLNRLVLYAFLPALVFHTVIQSDIDRLFFAIPAAAATGVLTCLALSFAIFHFLPIPGPTKGAMILAAAFGNVTYFGLPVLLGLFPDHPTEAAQTSVLFEVTKSSLNLTLGAMIAIAYGSHEKITFRKTALEALKLPPIWALVAALVWKSLHIPCPAFLLSATGLMAASVSGMMILSLGMALRFRIPRRAWLALPVAGVKLAASPLIVAAAAGAVGLSGIFRDMTVMEGAMPSQLLSFVIAGRFKLDDETLAFVIMIDTILAFVTLPVVHSLLASG